MKVSRRSHRLIFIFLMLVNLGVWLLYLFTHEVWDWHRIVSLFGVILSGMAVALAYRKNIELKYANYVLFAVSICWLLIGEYMFGFLMLANTFITWHFLKPKSIVLADEGVKLPGINRFFNWGELSNFVVRHRVLTIETDQNHFLQYDIPEGFDEEAIRSFSERKMM